VRASRQQQKTAVLLGLAFDNKDEQTRVTRGKNFLLWGGSTDTHSLMQETAVKINECLDRQGKRLEDVSFPELRDICNEVSNRL
jgi:hypothetical protein